MCYLKGQETWKELLESMKKCQTLFKDVKREIIEKDQFKYALALASQHPPGSLEAMSIPKDLQRRLDLIESREIRILIAGDVSAGKSTLMNILLGGKYFPVQFLSTTKVFCEVQHCMERTAVIKFENDEDHHRDRIIPLAQDPKHTSWETLRQCIKTKKLDGKQIRKVLVMWPLELQQNIIDPDQTTPKTRWDNDPDQTTPMRVVGDDSDQTTPRSTLDNDPDQTTPMRVVGDDSDHSRPRPTSDNDPDQTTPMRVAGDDSDQTTPKASWDNDPDQTTPMKVVDDDDLDQRASNTKKECLQGYDKLSWSLLDSSKSEDPDADDRSNQAATRGDLDGIDLCRTEPENKNSDTSASMAQDEERDEFKIIFVDTPGITSRTATEHEVFDEIETAGSLYQAFILVNDGLIREEGFQKLMEDIEKSIVQRIYMMNPECALFITNKFDQVAREERHAVKQDVERKLLEKWPRTVKQNIIFMSASKEKIYGSSIISGSGNFLRGIKQLLRDFVTKAIRISMEEHCLWLMNLLEILHVIMKSGKQWVAARQTQKQLKRMLADFKSESIKLLEDLDTKSERELDKLYQKTSKELVQHINVQLVWDPAEINREIPNPDMEWSQLIDIVDNMIFKKIMDKKKREIEDLKKKHQMQWEKIYKSEIQRLKKLQDLLDGMGCQDKDQTGVMEGIATAMFPVAISGVLRVAPVTAPFLFLTVPLLPIPLLLKMIVDDYKDYQNEKLREDFKENKVAYFNKRREILMNAFQSSLRNRNGDELKRSPVFCNLFGISPKLQLMSKIKDIQDTIQMLETLESSKKSDESKVCEKYLAKTMEIYTDRILIHGIQADEIEWSTDEDGHRIQLGGTVYKAKTNSSDVAVKELKYKKSTSSQPYASLHSDLDLYKECFLLRQLSKSPCDNIVKFLGSSFKPDSNEHENICKLWLVFELCDGTLDDIIGRPVQDETERHKDFQWYASEIIKGLKFLHDKNIVHRDLKPSNCLLKKLDSNKFMVKVADFGASKQKDLICTHAVRRGTPFYWAPEIVKYADIRFHSKASDIYSLGLILWELWYRRHAYQDFNIILAEIPHRFPNEEEPREILQMCLKSHPYQRASICTLEWHPFLQVTGQGMAADGKPAPRME